MKAILMFGDLIMGIREIDDLRPELVFPISRVLNAHFWKADDLTGQLDPDDITNTIKMSFRLIDRGRKFGIYELRGFDK